MKTHDLPVESGIRVRISRVVNLTDASVTKQNNFVVLSQWIHALRLARSPSTAEIHSNDAKRSSEKGGKNCVDAFLAVKPDLH